MSESLSAYKGNCHCGTVRFTVRIPSLDEHEVLRCNCSICSRNGYLKVFPKPGDFVFHSGYEDMTAYTFDTKQFVHRFCSRCGSSVCIEKVDKGELCINVSLVRSDYLITRFMTYAQARLFEDFDETKISIKSDDRKSKGTIYTATDDVNWEMTPELKVTSEVPYRASCHCGTVAYTVQLPQPLETYKVNKCNCSICTKNGYLLVYPLRTSVVFHRGWNNLKEYFFGNKIKPHKFCTACGSSILIDFKDRDLDYGINVSGR